VVARCNSWKLQREAAERDNSESHYSLKALVTKKLQDRHLMCDSRYTSWEKKLQTLSSVDSRYSEIASTNSTAFWNASAACSGELGSLKGRE